MTIEPTIPPSWSTASTTAASPKAFLPRARKHWYIVAQSGELGEKPISRTLFGAPMVLFRDARGQTGAFVDRCPHRNVPLSLGSVQDGRLVCAYHGWQFDTAGECRLIPSLTGKPEGKARRATRFATREKHGFVWVYGEPETEPTTEPHEFALFGDSSYTTVSRVVEARGTLYSTLENALDVPHTAFLHRGLFRSESRGITITARVRRTSDRVVAEYIGEPRPPGIVARVLSPSGGTVTHFDRFILPSIAQVEYRIGDENHILVDSVMTPVDDFFTRVYAVVSYRMRLPGALVKPVLLPLALRVFAQDAHILGLQTDSIHRFGGEQFASTEIDVLGKHIHRLLRAAERGEQVGEEEHEVELVV
jgi:phenylpropionate dioxygenase-like ring-hydroxylating dioxygenase large terminal subunit